MPASTVLTASRASVPPSSDTAYWSRYRRPVKPTDLVLMPMAQHWLAQLPPDLVPRALADRFPRIVNQLVLRLPYPDELADYVDSLLVDRRGNRQGFAPDVLRDLLRLHEYFRRTRAYGRTDFALAHGTPGARTAVHAGQARNRHAELELDRMPPRPLPVARRQRTQPKPPPFGQRALRLILSPILQFQR